MVSKAIHHAQKVLFALTKLVRLKLSNPPPSEIGKEG